MSPLRITTLYVLNLVCGDRYYTLLEVIYFSFYYPFNLCFIHSFKHNSDHSGTSDTQIIISNPFISACIFLSHTSNRVGVKE